MYDPRFSFASLYSLFNDLVEFIFDLVAHRESTDYLT
jgi:hypothetical protein